MKRKTILGILIISWICFVVLNYSTTFFALTSLLVQGWGATILSVIFSIVDFVAFTNLFTPIKGRFTKLSPTFGWWLLVVSINSLLIWQWIFSLSNEVVLFFIVPTMSFFFIKVIIVGGTSLLIYNQQHPTP
ncbi:hypothetical protein KKG65_00875 [Patescibacteria group bacterium]|nr:hypothetical protein [Patescibacteria group bacterium]